jgi:glycosyltransferase involved in cell wall biosynthesis
MRVSIGIFAHNEENQIGRLLASLAEQDLIADAAGRGINVEIITLANGCTDSTEAAANAANALLRKECPEARLRTELIPESGKSNAWNIYVHRFSDPSADFLIFMDADITLIGSRTLRFLVETLSQNQTGDISVDFILKDLALKQSPSLFEKASLSATRLNQAGPPKLAGSLYCARAQVVRRIWMPKGLLVEDGFLKAMITTDHFTQPEEMSRLVQARDAAHTFQAVTNLRCLLRHEVRLLIGTWMNVVLFEHLKTKVTETRQPAGDLIHTWNQNSPDWFRCLLSSAPTKRRIRQFSLSVIILPFKQALRAKLVNRLKNLPTAVLRSLFTCYALLFARSLIRRQLYKW